MRSSRDHDYTVTEIRPFNRRCMRSFVSDITGIFFENNSFPQKVLLLCCKHFKVTVYCFSWHQYRYGDR